MRIESDISQLLPLNAYRRKQDQVDGSRSEARGETDRAAAGESGGDRVSLSTVARTMTEAARVAQESPDVRSEKVAELKAQVEAGTYAADSRRTAAALLREDMLVFG